MTAVTNTATYLTKPLLLMMPHAVDSKPLVRTASGAIAEAIAGPRVVETVSAPPGAIRQYTFVTESRADTRALEDFFDSCLGAHDGFWMPTWQWEFEIQDRYLHVDGHHDFLWVKGCDYSALYALGHAYRHVLLLYADLYAIIEAQSVADNDPGGTTWEKIGYDPSVAGLGALVAPPFTEAKGVRPSWLRYVRFADDEIEQVELGDDSAQFTVHVVELPNETPGS
jgi:hypothetical protein